MGYLETPHTTAMREGLEKEDEIAQVFVSEMTKKGCSGVSLEGCGFFISKSHGFLEASPDRIIQLPTQSSPGVLEMKYIKVKSGETLKDVLLKQSICKQHETSLILNKNHKYYFQLCHQMFSTSWPMVQMKFSCKRLNLKNNSGSQYFKNLLVSMKRLMLPEIVLPKVKYGLPRTKL